MDIEALHERSGDAPAILRNLRQGASAVPEGITIPSAGAGVHSRDELELGWILRVIRSPGDGYNTGFQGFTQRLEGAAVVFQQLVQEQYSMVGKTDFAWAGSRSPAHEGDSRSGVMGRSNRTTAKAASLETCSTHRSDGGNFKRFRFRHRRQQTWKAHGKHAFASAWWAHHEK
jgi:hypothetical protein